MAEPTGQGEHAGMTREEAMAVWNQAIVQSPLFEQVALEHRQRARPEEHYPDCPTYSMWTNGALTDNNRETAAAFLREMADALEDHGAFKRIDAWELWCFNRKGGGCGKPFLNAEYETVEFCRDKDNLQAFATSQGWGCDWQVDLKANTATCPACFPPEEDQGARGPENENDHG